MSEALTKVGLSVNAAVLTTSNNPLVSDGNIGLNFAPSGVKAGTYQYPRQLTVDQYGRVLNVVEGSPIGVASGTVTSVSAISVTNSIQVTGSPILVAGTIGVDLPQIGKAGVYSSPTRIQTDGFGRISDIVAGGVSSPYYVVDFGKVSLKKGTTNYIPCQSLRPGVSLLFQPIIASVNSENYCVANIQTQPNFFNDMSNTTQESSGFFVNLDSTTDVTAGYYAIIASASAFPPAFYQNEYSSVGQVTTAGMVAISTADQPVFVSFPQLQESSVVILSSYDTSQGAAVINPMVFSGFSVVSSSPGIVYYFVVDRPGLRAPVKEVSLLSGGSLPLISGDASFNNNSWSFPLYGCSPKIAPDGGVIAPTDFAVFPCLIGGTNPNPVACGYVLNAITSPYSTASKAPQIVASVSIGSPSSGSLPDYDYMTDISTLILTW